MANLNKVLLIGNLTRDPEIRYTTKGTPVCNAGLAVNRRWKSADGGQQEETTFVDIDFWGRSAEVFHQYMRKGKPVFIEGRLKLDSWENREGQKRSKLMVVAENFQFLGSRDDSPRSGGQAGNGRYSQSPRSKPTPSHQPAEGGGERNWAKAESKEPVYQENFDDMVDDEIPF